MSGMKIFVTVKLEILFTLAAAAALISGATNGNCNLAYVECKLRSIFKRKMCFFR